MAFSNAEIQEIKNYLGYGNLTASARPYFDIAAVFEDVVQDNIDAWGQTYVTGTILVNIRAALVAMAPSNISDQMLLQQGCEGAQPNPKALQDLERLKDFWIDRLAETLKVPRARLPNSKNCIVQF